MSKSFGATQLGGGSKEHEDRSFEAWGVGSGKERTLQTLTSELGLKETQWSSGSLQRQEGQEVGVQGSYFGSKEEQMQSNGGMKQTAPRPPKREVSVGKLQRQATRDKGTPGVMDAKAAGRAELPGPPAPRPLTPCPDPAGGGRQKRHSSG